MCLIAVTPDGDRSMNTFLGAARELSSGDVDEKKIASAQILYIEGYLWDAPSAKEACLKAIKQAKKSGTKVAFTLSDPSGRATRRMVAGRSRHHLRQRGRSEILVRAGS
jgi:sugar/nucleoside kinase (ribokinase family)